MSTHGICFHGEIRTMFIWILRLCCICYGVIYLTIVFSVTDLNKRNISNNKKNNKQANKRENIYKQEKCLTALWTGFSTDE